MNAPDLTASDNAASFQPAWVGDLAAGKRQTNWLWHGFLAPGMTTLLTSQAKSGKTTLIAALLARLKDGGQFAGLDLRAGKAVIVSEESTFLWNQRSERLGFGDQLCWFCRPFAARPSPADWHALQDAILRLHERHHFDLIVIDPLIEFLPCGTENSAVGVSDYLRSLRRFSAVGLASVILHHPRKGQALEGQAARGSSALTGFADINMEMSFYTAGDDTDRRRKIRTFSRLDATPRRLVLELNAEGNDYISHGDFESDDFMQNWQQVRVILQGEQPRMSRKEILHNWSPDFPAPVTSTLGRWLERAAELGLVKKHGEGSKSKPYQYYLPERDADEFFRYFTLMERAVDEYHRILTTLGYFPPFLDVPKQIQLDAQRQADERVYGPGGQESFVWSSAKAATTTSPAVAPQTTATAAADTHPAVPDDAAAATALEPGPSQAATADDEQPLSGAVVCTVDPSASSPPEMPATDPASAPPTPAQRAPERPLSPLYVNLPPGIHPSYSRAH
jgi:hypothetical protein